MCTAIKFRKCMGRNYDYEKSYDEEIINLPKDYEGNHYAMIGIGTGLVKEYPLFYDAMNEHGLCCSALAFSGNAQYNDPIDGKENIPSYDFITRILGNNETVNDARDYIRDCNITNEPYNAMFPNSDLHWIICDKEQSIIVEQTKNGLQTYDNPYDTLTNNPPFNLMCKAMEWLDERIGEWDYPTGVYESRGTGTVGVKGDTTSISRFQRIHYYMRQMSKPENDVCSDDASTLHLLDLVKQTWGATPVNDSYEYTIYSAVYDMENLEIMVKPYTRTRVQKANLVNRHRRIKI